MNKKWELTNKSDYQDHGALTECQASGDMDHSLEKGSKVKLMFNSIDVDSNKQMTELLWVEILLVQDNMYLGQLEDDPKLIKNLIRGEMIDFEKRHIFELEYIDPFDSSIKV